MDTNKYVYRGDYFFFIDIENIINSTKVLLLTELDL